MAPLASTALVSNLEAGLRIFAVGFSGVFLNLALIMGVLKAIDWGVKRYEQQQESAVSSTEGGSGSDSKEKK